MTRPRDSFASRVYNAEQVFAQRYAAAGTQRASLHYSQQKAVTDRIAKSPWWRKRRPDISVFSVQQTRTRNYCNTDIQIVGGKRCVGVLHLAADADLVDVLHAAAHYLHPENTAWHGPEFAKAMLDIVGKYISLDARRELANVYKEHKVKTVSWSAEAKEGAKRRYAERDLKALLAELSSESEAVTPPS